MKVLVTGSAGFIGYHVARRLSERGDVVVGVDNLNAYYDVELKRDRVAQLEKYDNFDFRKLDVSDRDAMRSLFGDEEFDRIVHLAAQAGVRYSLKKPLVYADSNLVGFVNILEGCRTQTVDHLVFASSSSVYGANQKMPFSERDPVDHPLSLYAATKRSNELLAHSYAHMHGLPVTGLRFFTVYGPWGRPDMALFLFTEAMLEGRPIRVFNHGDMRRDFTYIDDIVEGVTRVLDKAPTSSSAWSDIDRNPSNSRAPYQILNIGSGRPVELMRFIALIEAELGVEAEKEYLPLQDGDIEESYCDVTCLDEYVGYQPPTSIEDGVKAFVDWYCTYYRTGCLE